MCDPEIGFQGRLITEVPGSLLTETCFFSLCTSKRLSASLRGFARPPGSSALRSFLDLCIVRMSLSS